MDFTKTIPNQIFFSLRELEEIGVLKVSTAKKFVSKGLLAYTKVGNKLFISRDEIIRFLNKNTVEANDE